MEDGTHTVLLALERVPRAVCRLSPQVTHKALKLILGLPNVRVEKADRIAKSLSCYALGMDFGDGLNLPLAAGVERLVTFDQRFAKSAAAQHLRVELL